MNKEVKKIFYSNMKDDLKEAMKRTFYLLAFLGFIPAVFCGTILEMKGYSLLEQSYGYIVWGILLLIAIIKIIIIVVMEDIEKAKIEYELSSKTETTSK